MTGPESIEHLQIPADSLQSAVVQVIGPGVSVRSERRLAGGSINDTRRIELSDGTELFLKQNSKRHGGLFVEEARGLSALAAAGGPVIPRPLAIFEDRSSQYLLMDYIPTGRPGPGFWPRFGIQLAEMHRQNRSPRPGFYADNHIGSTPQPNAWMSNWHEFFGERRLRFQIELLRKRGLADQTMERQTESLIKKLPNLIPDLDDGGASILHGDLWGGNYMVSAENEPVLIDPAVYYGHREADLAMTQLFGGFAAEFYRSYEERFPLVPGYESRRDVYNLYHLLNHANLFGSSYLGSCRAILKRFA